MLVEYHQNAQACYEEPQAQAEQWQLPIKNPSEPYFTVHYLDADVRYLIQDGQHKLGWLDKGESPLRGRGHIGTKEEVRDRLEEILDQGVDKLALTIRRDGCRIEIHDPMMILAELDLLTHNKAPPSPNDCYKCYAIKI